VISAVTGEGVEAARILMASQLTALHKVQRIYLTYSAGRSGGVASRARRSAGRRAQAEGHVLTVRLDPADSARFERLWPAKDAPTP
jgi:GTP-binding protein HflX